MNSSARAQTIGHSVLGVIALTTILFANTACAATQAPISQPDWRTKIVQAPLPKKGCFAASYPSLQWREVACATASNQPGVPAPARGGPSPGTVGNYTNDYLAQVMGHITQASGSFPLVTNVTGESETDITGGPVLNSTDVYSLQLNTNWFNTTAAVCTAHPSCTGWEQFFLWNPGPASPSSPSAYIEYWLIAYNAACPSGWHSQAGVPTATDTSCWVDSQPVAVAPQSIPITNLGSLSLTATANEGGSGMDTVITVPGTTAHAMGADSMLNLAPGWTEAEFNIFGDTARRQANFNANATIVVQTTVHSGTTAAPTCLKRSYTGETNNLTLVGAPVFSTAPAPAIEFTESNVPGAPAACATAVGFGDTHLQTFSGLFYDFQATGDFLLAQTKDFAVQTRQVSLAPTSPYVSVNQAVATQMGSDQVALCAAPTAPARLVLNGAAADLADGHRLSSPSGVSVVRTGNVYRVTDQSGNSLRAVMNAGWIDVSVGLGAWPTPVRGLLANANGNVHQLAASDGTVFNVPVSFGDLYGRYGESWRVAPANSLLAACGGGALENGMPSKPFFANDLTSSIHDQARASCANAGVQAPVLLDACTLDVAALGTKDAAAVYVGAPAPAAVGEAGQG
jgi:hypothetical protein